MSLCERLVAAGTLMECKTGGDKRVCDGAVTKELKSTTPSVQVFKSWQIDCFRDLMTGFSVLFGVQIWKCMFFTVQL